MEENADPPMIVRSLEAGGFIRANLSFLTRVGFSEDELAQHPFIDWIDAADHEAFRQSLESGAEHCRVRHRTSFGTSFSLDLQFRPQTDTPVVLGRAAEDADAAELDGKAEAEATVKGTLHKIAEIVEAQNPGYKCSILLVAHGRFVKGAGPSLPDEYNNAIDGFAIGPTVGSCGTAIYWNTPVIVADIQNDPLWAPFAELAKTAGVAACWSHPFATKGGRVLGALALYSPVPCSPTAEQLSRLRAAAQLTGLAVERGRAEEQLRSANQVKARFMANMSHEIRTPLNALIGLTDTLQESKKAAPLDVGMLRDASEQLLELFTGVLEMTEVQDRGHQDEVVDLHACCHNVLAPLESMAREKGLRAEVKLSSEVPQCVHLDEWAFERALRLLVHNAIKFTTAGTVTVSVDIADRELQVQISDTGSGIDFERLNELRQPFVQGDLSTTKQYAGFGLGLALSDLCVAALGGTLEFSANEPKGTTVRLGIPVNVAAPPCEDGKCRPSTTDEPTSLPILVAEDNPLNSKVIERILQKSGYRVQLTENGEQALQALDESSFCCVLMDIQMPVMDGYEATRRIRASEEATGRHIPIIAVTANALAEDRALCLEAGMDDYLKKPVRRQELVEALEEYVGSPVSEA